MAGRFHLHDRTLTRVAQLSAAALLALGLVLATRNELAFRRQTVDATVAQADVLASSLTAALSFDDRAALAQYVSAFKANPGIGSAAVYNVQGQRIAVSVLPGEPAPPPIARAASGWKDGRATALRPSVEKGERLGFVYLQTRHDTLTNLAGRHSGILLLTIMALLLLVMIGAAANTLQRRALDLMAANTRLTDEMEARVRAEEALRQSQKMEALGQLTGGIAHDFNNLLQVIIGTLDVLRRRGADPGRIERLSSNALQAAERGAALTRQLLAFSRTQKLELKTFFVGDAIGAMQDMLERTLGAEIVLSLDLRDENLPVRSDPNQLELAVLNLAINARDAMPNGGRLSLTTEVQELADGQELTLAPGRYVVLRASDTGVGMPRETAERAFDPFFTTKTVGKGTGLGLSQVYGLARQSGGAARIESTPGQGTTVIVYLHGAQGSVENASIVAEADGAVFAARPGTRVLVLDDDEAVRGLLAETLVLLGYQVVQAADGEIALQTIAEACPDLLIADFAMPGMNGAQVANQARALCPHLPIMFASGHSDTDAIRAAVGSDALILQKPYHMDTLARAVFEVAARAREIRDGA